MIQLLKRNLSLDTFHEHKISDAEKIKNGVVNVFTQTYFFSEAEISTNHTFLVPHGYFSDPKNFAQKLATHYSSPKFDVDYELSAKKDTSLDNYAFSDYLSSKSATILRKISLQ